jgi:signal peptidase I
MSPTLEVDDIILSKHPSDTSNLDVGEIITFKTEAGTTVTHRIIAIITTQDGRIAYQTQGDNPINSPDLNPVTPDQVQAVFVFKFPGFQ